METSSEKLRKFFEHFPGVSARQAARFVYYIFSLTEKEKKELSKLILNVQEDVHQCKKCMRYFQITNSNNKDYCQICLNQNRDAKTLMVVSSDADIKQIEQVGYNGVYFVLGGVLSLNIRKNKKIRQNELIEYIKTYSPNEIILALPVTTDGDYTTDQIVKTIKEKLPSYKDKISILGRGLATGTEIEYADKQTIKHALKNKEKLI